MHFHRTVFFAGTVILTLTVPLERAALLLVSGDAGSLYARALAAKSGGGGNKDHDKGGRDHDKGDRGGRSGDRHDDDEKGKAGARAKDDARDHDGNRAGPFSADHEFPSMNSRSRLRALA